jgi:dipeptidyl aminopeptidase/acylaminoacyl peptidase
MRTFFRPAVALAVLALVSLPARGAAQSGDTEVIRRLESQNESMRHRLDQLQRMVDDLMFFNRLGDIADIDIVRLTGEMLEQGYTVVAPEYRGSTGYGRGTYETIDYGGLETEDTYAARNFMLENYDFLDAGRVGIVGWSHGGLHALMNIFDHGGDYAVAYAGVPVSDLIARMGYKTQGYRDMYSADYHIGKTAYEDVEEYRRRSPSWNAHRYDGTPLLIHTNTNDGDVNVLEVERLIQALKAEGKRGFEYRIYQDAPGGHSFNRLDTRMAKESRREIWRFLAPHLRPVRPIR